MKFVFCANCGTKLIITRKALPKYGAIIDLIEQHECLPDFIEPDLTPVQVPTFVKATEVRKFANRLEELSPSVPFKMNETIEPGDRRSEEDVRSDIKSTAPLSLLESLKNSTE